MAVNLKKLSLDELKALQKDVAAAIAGFEKQRRKDALAAAQKAAREHGFSLDEILGKAAKSGGSKGVAKYANPADPSQTWTGRGRQPNWIKEALSSGKSLEDMAI